MLPCAGVVAIYGFVHDDEFNPALLLRQLSFAGLGKHRDISAHLSGVVAWPKGDR